MNFLKGDTAIPQEQIALLIKAFKGKLWWFFYLKEGTLCAINTTATVTVAQDSKNIKV